MKIDNKGFTLVEVLAVVVIIGILGGLTAKGVLSSINTGKEASYKLMINSIVTASQTLYEELEYGGSTVWEYSYSNNEVEKKGTKVTINDDNTINTNLQTLVSNGFLSGSSGFTDEDESGNKYLIDPKIKKNIGSCKITITKSNAKSNDIYLVNSVDDDDDDICPKKYNNQR